jgi:hypothetical protein
MEVENVRFEASDGEDINPSICNTEYALLTLKSC